MLCCCSDEVRLFATVLGGNTGVEPHFMDRASGKPPDIFGRSHSSPLGGARLLFYIDISVIDYL